MNQVQALSVKEIMAGDNDRTVFQAAAQALQLALAII